MFDGTYNLRASPAYGVGGMYMTSNGLDKVVTTVAQVPPYFAQQKWTITPVPNEEHTYHIYFDSPAGATSSSTEQGVEQQRRQSLALLHREHHDHKHHHHLHDESCVPHGPLVVSEAHEDKWEIFSVTLEEIPNTYIIKPVTRAVGMNWLVGTQGNEVIIKALPITENPPEYFVGPYWQIA